MPFTEHFQAFYVFRRSGFENGMNVFRQHIIETKMHLIVFSNHMQIGEYLKRIG